eukprot:CAMPEP_0115315086 /NCGR_PEP_ID=MMETSP0270-20121206/77388_1 /TAXON_ID=71861 /ORGANISM="Scrippsiella trochoidea, Strain CCMP3099" /LENGTH=253 /DNA_ID=CAMNT_0002734375 /DNA_START=1 /DNA_END=760 /DNA_ORIENTATION=-
MCMRCEVMAHGSRFKSGVVEGRLAFGELFEDDPRPCGAVPRTGQGAMHSATVHPSSEGCRSSEGEYLVQVEITDPIPSASGLSLSGPLATSSAPASLQSDSPQSSLPQHSLLVLQERATSGSALRPSVAADWPGWSAQASVQSDSLQSSSPQTPLPLLEDDATSDPPFVGAEVHRSTIRVVVRRANSSAARGAAEKVLDASCAITLTGIELCRHQEGNAEEYNGEGSTSPYVVARNSEAHHRPGLLALIDGIA